MGDSSDFKFIKIEPNDIVNNEGFYLVNTQFDIKTEPFEEGNEFPTVSTTSNDSDFLNCTKEEINEPDIEMDTPNFENESVFDPLSTSSNVKEITSNKINIPDREKRKRSSITIEKKIRIIAAYEKGWKIAHIARQENLPPSTVSTMIREKNKIKEFAKGIVGKNSKKISKSRAMNAMEKLLYNWIIETKDKIPLTIEKIQSKAKNIFNTIKNETGEEEAKFHASRGWFQKFKRRYDIDKLKLFGNSNQGDITFIDKFKTDFQGYVKGNKYIPEQIFNVAETGLHWKRIAKKLNVEQDSVMLLLGGNMAGHKLKPLLITHLENSVPYLGDEVLYVKNNQKSTITHLFIDWFNDCFIPEVQEYLQSKKIPFKVLLILDSTPVHPKILNQLNENVKVIFLPVTTKSKIQPMDQGAITTFKAYYIKETFLNATTATLPEFWNRYDLQLAIKNISRSWQNVSTNIMKETWCELLNVDLVDKFDVKIVEIIIDIINLGKRVGVVLTIPEVKDLLNDDCNMVQHDPLDFVEDKNDVDDYMKFIRCRNIVEHLKKLKELINSGDHVTERKNCAVKSVDELISAYEGV